MPSPAASTSQADQHARLIADQARDMERGDRQFGPGTCSADLAPHNDPDLDTLDRLADPRTHEPHEILGDRRSVDGHDHRTPGREMI